MSEAVNDASRYAANVVKQGDWLKPHQWAPGTSGNPAGRPPLRGPEIVRRKLDDAAAVIANALLSRIEAGDTQATIEGIRQLVGAPRVAVSVDASPTLMFQAAMSGMLERLGAIDAEVLELSPAPSIIKERKPRTPSPKRKV